MIEQLWLLKSENNYTRSQKDKNYLGRLSDPNRQLDFFVKTENGVAELGQKSGMSLLQDVVVAKGTLSHRKFD